jgi:hypothetical protein
LLEDLFRHTELDGWRQDDRSVRLIVEGANVELCYDEAEQAGMFQIGVDCGPQPKAGSLDVASGADVRARVCRRLMELNAMVGAGGRLAFSVSPESSRCVLTVQMALHIVCNGETLADALGQLVWMAHQLWSMAMETSPLSTEAIHAYPLLLPPLASNGFNAAHYRALLRDMCKATGIKRAADIDAVIRAGAIRMRGLRIVLRYHEAIHSDRIECRLTLPEVEETAPASDESLLRSNHIFGLRGELVFCRHPNSAQPAAVLQCNMAELQNGAALAEWLETLVRELDGHLHMMAEVGGSDWRGES